MSERNAITLGIKAQNHDTLNLDISKFYTTTGEDGVVSINFNKQENENKIVEELNTLISQEEKSLTGNNINRIEELLNKLPFEEKRIEMTYRKDEILKSLKVQKEIQDIENNISDENNIIKVEDIFSLMNKYKEINKINRNSNTNQIEDSLIKLHNDKFEQLLSKENYSLKSVDDNIEKYEEFKNYTEKLEKNIKFLSNTSLKDTIMYEINSLNNIKSNIESKLMKLLNCDKLSLEESIKSQKLINTINSSDSSEEIDIALIENNFVDYINLGQKKRKRALAIFIENTNKNYSTIEEVFKDLEDIVSELKKQLSLTDTIEL